LGHVVISVPPEGGARSQLEVRTAPGPRLASETNNDCQVKFELLHHIVKNLFRHKKLRYRGLAKNTAQLYALFALANLVIVRKTLLVQAR
jgi:IS5 family transposase